MQLCKVIYRSLIHLFTENAHIRCIYFYLQWFHNFIYLLFCLWRVHSNLILFSILIHSEFIVHQSYLQRVQFLVVFIYRVFIYICLNHCLFIFSLLFISVYILYLLFLFIESAFSLLYSVFLFIQQFIQQFYLLILFMEITFIEFCLLYSVCFFYFVVFIESAFKQLSLFI